MRPLLILIAVLASLCMPAAALAQSAGDEQYEDPFAGEDQGQSQSGGGSDGGGAQQPATPAPSGSAPEGAPEPAPGAAPSAPAAATSQSQLPRTGAGTGAFMLAGSILLAGGVVLRVRLRERS